VDGGANAFGISRVEYKNKHQPPTDHNRVEEEEEKYLRSN